MKRIKVVIAEEQQHIRKNLRLMISSEPDMQIVGEVNNGLDALDIVGNQHPDILILGLSASNTSDIIRRVHQRFPDTVVVVPRGGDNKDRIVEMMRAGVKAYTLKTSSSAKFINTIRKVGSGKTVLDTPVSERAAVKADRYLEKSTIDPYEVLTKREREVLNLVVSGLTNAMIADQLDISRRTVEIHRANMLRKLGLHNQYEQLRKYAVERKILGDTDRNKQENSFGRD